MYPAYPPPEQPERPEPAASPTVPSVASPVDSFAASSTAPPVVRRRRRRPADPFAVALGNASLLGIGYLLLGRRTTAVLTTGVSFLLILVIGTAERAGWLQYALFAWWVAVVVHGCYLAARRPAPPDEARRQRLIAVAVAVPVLATFVLVRVDADGKADDADAAHRAGDCDRVIAAVADVGFWQRLGDAPEADRLLDSAEACRVVEWARQQAKDDREAAAVTMARYEQLPEARWTGARRYRSDLLLDQAEADLAAGLSKDLAALGNGFDLLTTVAGEYPSRREDAHDVLDGFLDELATTEACAAVEVTDWVNKRNTRTAELDRAAEVVPEVAPAALVGCADHLLAGRNGTAARVRYQQLTTEYPSHALVPRAKRGVTLANYAIQLEALRASLRTTVADEQPAYCTKPVAYNAAKPRRGPGPYRAVVFGQDFQRNSLPAGWRATDASNATIIICAGESTFGDAVETCQYSPSGASIGVVNFTFHRRKIPVRVFEVRTGRLVANTAIQISGSTCPQFVFTDEGATAQYVRPSTEDIRNAYRGLIIP